MLHNKFAKALKWKPSEDRKQLKALEKVFIYSKGFKPFNSDEVNIDIAQLSASKDICIKKLVYLYVALSSYCSKDIFLHVMNSLANDLTDPNPVVRNASLQSSTEIMLKEQTNFEFVYNAILQGLQDSAASVRISAINGVVRLYQKMKILPKSDDHFLSEITNTFQKINSTIKTDPDPAVVVRCLECLTACGAPRETLNPVILSLLHKVSLLDPYLILVVVHRANVSLNCTLLKTNEKFMLLNKLETLRNLTTNCSLTVEAFSLMLKLSTNLENVQNDVLVEIVSNMIALFSVCNKSARYFILSSLYAILRVYCVQIQEFFLSKLYLFLLWNDDDSYVLMKKLDILNFCINDETAMIILSNVRPYCLKNHLPCVVKETFYLLRTLYNYAPDICQRIVYCSLYSNFSIVTDSAIVLLHYITIQQAKHDKDYCISSKLTSAILACYKHLSSLEAKTCFLMLVSYVTDLDCSRTVVKILGHETAEFFECSSQYYQYCVLVVLLRCFLRWPHLFHVHVKNLFSIVLKNPKHTFIHEQTKIYYRFLQKNDYSQLKICLNFDKIPLVSLPFIIRGGKVNLVLNDIQAVAMCYD